MRTSDFIHCILFLSCASPKNDFVAKKGKFHSFIQFTLMCSDTDLREYFNIYRNKYENPYMTVEQSENLRVWHEKCGKRGITLSQIDNWLFDAQLLPSMLSKCDTGLIFMTFKWVHFFVFKLNLFSMNIFFLFWILLEKVQWFNFYSKVEQGNLYFIRPERRFFALNEKFMNFHFI